jgi:hypothetical protein
MAFLQPLQGVPPRPGYSPVLLTPTERAPPLTWESPHQSLPGEGDAPGWLQLLDERHWKSDQYLLLEIIHIQVMSATDHEFQTSTLLGHEIDQFTQDIPVPVFYKSS